MTDATERSTEIRDCPFPECDWTHEYDPDDWHESYQADERSEMHYEKEHAGKVEIQVTLERTQRIGNRDMKDIREHYFDEDQFLGWDVAHTRTKILDEASNHSALNEDGGDDV